MAAAADIGFVPDGSVTTNAPGADLGFVPDASSATPGSDLGFIPDRDQIRLDLRPFPPPPDLGPYGGYTPGTPGYAEHMQEAWAHMLTPGLLLRGAGYVATEGAKTLRDVLNPETYLPDSAKQQPFVIDTDKGEARTMTPEEVADRDPLQPNKPLWTAPRNPVHPEATDLGRMAEQWSSPQGAVTFAASMFPPTAPLVAADMATSLPQQVLDLAQGSGTDEDKRDRINNAIATAAMLVGPHVLQGARAEISPEAVGQAEVRGQTEEALRELQASGDIRPGAIGTGNAASPKPPRALIEGAEGSGADLRRAVLRDSGVLDALGAAAPAGSASPRPIAAKVDDLAAAVRELQDTLTRNQVAPETSPESSAEGSEGGETPTAPAGPTEAELTPLPSQAVIRTPDGRIDLVETALARIREEAEHQGTDQPAAGPGETGDAGGSGQEQPGGTLLPAAEISEEQAADPQPAAQGVANLTKPAASGIQETAAPETVTGGTEAGAETPPGLTPTQKGVPPPAGTIPADAGETPARSAAASRTRQSNRLPDLIDAAQGAFSRGIDPTLIKERDPYWKPTGAARKLFRKGGVRADVAADSLYRSGDYGGDPAKVEEFGDAVNRAAQGRIGDRQKAARERQLINQESAFARDVSRPGRNQNPILSDDLQVGDSITIRGTPLKVRAMEFDDDGRVSRLTLDDGAKYGTQEVPGGTELTVDKGSLAHSNEPTVTGRTPEGNNRTRLAPPGEAGTGGDNPTGQALHEGPDSLHEGPTVQGREQAPVNERWLSYRRERLQSQIEALEGQERIVQPHAAEALAKVPRTPQGELNLKALKSLPDQDINAVFHLEHLRSQIAQARLDLARLTSVVYPGAESYVEAQMRRGQPGTAGGFAGWLDRAIDATNPITHPLGGGSVREGVLGAPIWLSQAFAHGTLMAVRAAMRAGLRFGDAIEKGIDWLRDRNPDGFNEGEARDWLMKQAVSERTPDQIKSELAEADQAARAAVRKQPGQTIDDYRQASALAGARYRQLREELLSHPDYVAEQLAKHHAATAEANRILASKGLPPVDDYGLGNTMQAQERLSPEDYARVRELSQQIGDARSQIDQMPGRLVSRVYSEMQADGRLPKSEGPAITNAGRTLDQMTEYLRTHQSDSPRLSFADRLALGRKFADAWQGVKDAAGKAWLKAAAAWSAMRESYLHPPIDDDFRSVMKDWISYDQRTGVEGYKWVKALQEAVPSKVRREAMSIWLEANGDRGLLEAQRQQVPEKYRATWDAALRLTPGEQRMAMQIKANFAAKLEDALNVGLVKKGRADYGVPQRWKNAPEIGPSSDPFGEGAAGKPGNPTAKLDPRDPFFSFERTVPTYFDGIMSKGVPQNLDIAHLVNEYDAAFHKALSSRGAIRALQDARAPDGTPIVKVSGSVSRVTRDGDPAFLVDSNTRPPDAVTKDGRPYQSVDHWALRDWAVRFRDAEGNPIIVRGDMLVHPDYVKWLKNELETPRWTTEGVGAAVLKTSGFLKASKFVGPFHVVTEALHASFHGVAPSVHGFNLDLSDPKQALLSRNMVLGFGRAREMFEDGLSSQHGIWGMIPGLGDAVVRMNRFTFEEYIPRLKMKVGLAVLERNIARYSGKVTTEQIGELTGRQMDAAFGGQNWRLMGANKGLLGVMRLTFVAPDFLVSRAKVVAQAFKPYNQEQRVFLLAQAAGVYALCRVANAIFSDDNDPHFEPRNWDSVVIGNRAYHARFIVSDAANLGRDLLGLGSYNQHGIPFISGRLGALVKTLTEMVTGDDLFTGQSKVSEHNPALRAAEILVKDTAEWMTPMAVDGFIGGAAKGQTGLGQVAAATFGVSSRKESPSAQTYERASDFNRNSSDPAARLYQQRRDTEKLPASDFRVLDNLLDAGKLDAAQSAYNALVAAGHKPQSIAARYAKSYSATGSAKEGPNGEPSREQQFFDSLTPTEQRTYQRAAAERAARLEQFQKLSLASD